MNTNNLIGLQVIDAITRHYDITIPALLRPSRRQMISRARAMACYLLREHAKLTYQAIAEMIGVDHTTVVYHHHKLRDAIDPRIIEERDNAEDFYLMLVGIEYDQEIPF
jgi:chromosomal replication initiation ATPase DnaA